MVATHSLESLALALEQGRLAAPYTEHKVIGLVDRGEAAVAAHELGRLAALGVGAAALAEVLWLLVAERRETQRVADRIELVWSGPEGMSAASRDTGAVVRQLFATAKARILIASYALDTGERARDLFGGVAARIDEDPGLLVRMFVNVKREHGDETPGKTLVERFAARLRDQVWPGRRLPEVYYDPRALELGTGPRACLHAKCIVVDGLRAFITSANFTEAAQARNIEAGTLIEDATLSKALEAQFEALVSAGQLSALAEASPRHRAP